MKTSIDLVFATSIDVFVQYKFSIYNYYNYLCNSIKKRLLNYGESFYFK